MSYFRYIEISNNVGQNDGNIPVFADRGEGNVKCFKIEIRSYENLIGKMALCPMFQVLIDPVSMRIVQDHIRF